MNSIQIIAWAKIKKHKNQNLTVLASLALPSLLFTTTLLLLQSIQRPFDLLFEQTNASHILLFFDRLQEDEAAMTSWLEQQDEVVSITPPTPVYTTNKLLFQDREINKSIQLVERQSINQFQDKVLIVEGAKRAQPRVNEIWLPQHLAKANGIAIGDTIRATVVEGIYALKVSALVVDPHYASAIMNPTRAWVAPGNLGLILPLGDLQQAMMGIRLQDAQQADAVWNRFHTHFKYSGVSFDYHFFKSVFLSVYNILLAILLIFSALAILIALFILSSSIANAIRTDYRQIGILKVQGFSNSQIRALYFTQYFALLLLSLPFSLLLSYVLSQQLIQGLLEAVGISQLNTAAWRMLLLSAGIFCALVSLVIYSVASKATRIRPVEAIRFGAAEKTVKTLPFKTLIHRVRLPAFLSIRLLFANQKQSLFTLISCLFAVFLLTFSANVAHSFFKMSEQKTLWGFEEAELLIQRNEAIAIPLGHKDFLALLEEEAIIERVMPFSYQSASRATSADSTAKELIGKVYADRLSKIGLVNVEGEHPNAEGEIALAVLTAKEKNMEIGDTITLVLEGQLKPFRITGIYQDISNLGHGFRLHANAMRSINPLFSPDRYAVQLKDIQSIENSKQLLQQKLAETATIEESAEQRQEIRATINGVRTALWVFASFFLLVLLSIFFNDTLQIIIQEKRQLGIYKTIGFSTTEIRSIFVYRNVLLVALGLTIGLPLSLLFLPPLVNVLTQSIGIVDFPYLTNYLGLLLLLPALFLAAIGSVWLGTNRIVGLKARNLLR